MENKMEHFYENIVGWFDFQDVYAQQVKEAKDGDIFVEIGTANGKSASFMCVEIYNSGKKIEFHTVDIFPDENKQYNQEANVRENLKCFEFCHVHKSDSQEFLKSLKNKSIKFIYIDGKHETNPLIFELMLSLNKITNDGTIGGHDYWTSFPNVKKTVDAFVEFMNLRYTIIDKSYIIKK